MKFGNSGARTKEMQDTITSSLRNMRDAGLDHVILSVIELPEDYAKAIRKDGFIDMAKCRHYSFEKLCPEEQAMILGQKSYQRVALTLESVCDEKNYSTEGIEFISRVKIFPMLPKLDPKSDFGYYPVIQFFDKTILTEAAKTLVDCEYTPQDISSKTRESIAKYLKAHQKINEPSPV